MSEKYRTAKGEFAMAFFGLPLHVSMERQRPDSKNYADVQFYFADGYCPNGCQLYKVKDLIEEIFGVKAEILPEDGVNKIIKFKYVGLPYYGPVMSDDIASGMCGVIGHLVRQRYAK